MTDVQDIQRRIIELDVEHRDLDAVIAMLTADGHADQLQRLEAAVAAAAAAAPRRTSSLTTSSGQR